MYIVVHSVTAQGRGYAVVNQISGVLQSCWKDKRIAEMTAKALNHAMKGRAA